MGCGMGRGSFAGFRFGLRAGFEFQLAPLLEERHAFFKLVSVPCLPSDEADGAEEKGGNETAQEAFARRHWYVSDRKSTRLNSSHRL